jgi:DNA-binding transcriptional ArsR family regulator
VNETDHVDATLQAISHPGRRVMLRLAWDAERTSSELADAVGLSRSAASQHLRVLRDAKLVEVRVDGNRRLYRVDPQRLTTLRSFLDDFWGERLDALKHDAEDTNRRQRGKARRQDSA